MPQPSPGSPHSPNIPGTPSAVARRGPAKPLHTETWREWAPGPAHTHTQTNITWDEDCIHIRIIKINTTQLKWVLLLPPFPHPIPSHPFPVSYYYPHLLIFSWTHKEYWTTLDKIGKGTIGQVNPQKYELFWCDHCYRGDNRMLGHRESIFLCWLLLSLLAVLPLDGTFQRWGTPALHSHTPEWPTSPAAPNAAKLHCEERRNNPPATFIALPKTGWGKSFKSPSKLLTMLHLIFVGMPISTPGGFLLSSTIIIYS